MAKRKAKTSKIDAPDEIPPVKQAAKDLVARVRKRWEVMKEADEQNRKKAMDDFKFINVPGMQWDDLMKTQRGQRPCYEFNELRIKCKRVINDMRANRPQAKVRGYEDNDVDTAEILEGLGRNIWNCSDADTTVDNAGEYQVGAGMGAWRIVTDYESDTSFDQDIYIEGIKNPFCLYADPAAKDPLKRDARDWILTEKIPRAVYDETYSDKNAVSFEADQFDDDDWGTDLEAEEVRIAEYWYKEPIDVELWLLKTGQVVDSTDEAAKQVPQDQIAKKRTAKSHKIMMAIVSGDAVLEAPLECAGKEHRFVQVYGESLVIDGKTQWHGLGRFSKDAQRNLNITQTSALESTARSLDAKFWATTKQGEGLLAGWQESIDKGYPVQFYNHDPNAPGPPARMTGPEVPIAMLQLGQQASRLLDSTTGIFPGSSLGAEGPEKSGRAIIARQQQGEIATFNYQDNMAKAVQRTWEILLDLIPEVYDTERTVRILGADGAEKYKKINTFVPNPQDPENPLKVNDLRQGKYDVTITVGPNFQTLRQEAAETWAQMAQSDPMLMESAGDLVYKSMDVPYAEQIAERRKALLPAPIQKLLQQDEKNIPPEARQALMQAEQAMQIVQQQTKLIEAAQQEISQEKADADKAKSEVQTAIANLKTEEARFEARIAKAEAELAKKGMDLQAMQGQDSMGKERETLQNEMSGAIDDINKSLAEYMQQQAGVIADILAKQQTHVIVPPRPKLVAVNIEKANGKTRAVPEYEAEGMMQ